MKRQELMLWIRAVILEPKQLAGIVALLIGVLAFGWVLAGHRVGIQARPQATATLAILLDVRAIGGKTTDMFTPSGEWDLLWSFDCSSAIQRQRFTVFLYDADGDLVDRLLDVAHAGDEGTTHMRSIDRYSLRVDTECSWHVTVRG